MYVSSGTTFSNKSSRTDDNLKDVLNCSRSNEKMKDNCRS